MANSFEPDSICEVNPNAGFLKSFNQCLNTHETNTLCSFHHRKEHAANDWRECAECLEAKKFGGKEEIVWLGVNHTNFAEDVWENVPSFEFTYCSACGKAVKINADAFTLDENGNKKHFSCPKD